MGRMTCRQRGKRGQGVTWDNFVHLRTRHGPRRPVRASPQVSEGLTLTLPARAWDSRSDPPEGMILVTAYSLMLALAVALASFVMGCSAVAGAMTAVIEHMKIMKVS